MTIANLLLLSGDEAVAQDARTPSVDPGTGYVYETLRDLECIEPGETCQLQYRNSLTTGSWSNVPAYRPPTVSAVF
jgi:hypothetical protein